MYNELSKTVENSIDFKNNAKDITETNLDNNNSDITDDVDSWNEPETATKESQDTNGNNQSDDPDNWSDPETKETDADENTDNDAESKRDDPDNRFNPDSELSKKNDTRDSQDDNSEIDTVSNQDTEKNENDDSTGKKSDVNIQTSDYPCSKKIDGVTYYYDDNGNLYRVGDDLLPNSKYEVNGYKYETDDKGRIISAEGKLRFKEREGRLNIRDSIEAIGKGDQKEGDDRGHLIGDQFDGSNGLENMIPQDAKINEYDFKNFENELAKAVKEGKDVYFKVEPIYEGDSRRPIAIMVTYTIDGKENVRIFPNSKE